MMEAEIGVRSVEVKEYQRLLATPEALKVMDRFSSKVLRKSMGQPEPWFWAIGKSRHEYNHSTFENGVVNSEDSR